ncbi:MAG TPA: metalloregulator ArsR/SmtB family transcription factor [Geobacteraceae bacterium]
MDAIAALFQSLEDPTRLRIMALLLEQGELCVCDLTAVLQLPQSTVSRHLFHLKNAGWLKDRREGVWIHYSIARNPGPIHQFLLPVLDTFLPATEAGKRDMERFKSLGKGSTCA